MITRTRTWRTALLSAATLAVLLVAPAAAAHTASPLELDPTTCSGDSDVAVLRDHTCLVPGSRDVNAFDPRTRRFAHLYGPDRYTTSATVATTLFPDATTVVIASGRSMVDAAAAGPLAHRLGAPILLADTTKTTLTGAVLPDETTAAGTALKALPVTHAVIIGGTSAISPAHEQSLVARGITTERLSGPDRYATSISIARHRALAGATQAFIASGRDDDLAGAVTAGGAGGALNMPILLADPGAETAAAAHLDAIGATAVLVTPGTSLAARPGARTVPGRRDVTRSIHLAEWAQARGVPATDVTLAADTAIPDALVAGATGTITLLTPPRLIGGDVLLWFQLNAVAHVTAVGGKTPIRDWDPDGASPTD